MSHARTLLRDRAAAGLAAASGSDRRRRPAPVRLLKLFASHPAKAALAATFLVTLLLLSPLLHCGYNGDDLINSSMPGILAEHATNVPSFIAYHIDKGVHQAGRFFPFVFYYFVIFASVRDLFVYRLLTLLMIGLNLFLFTRLVSRLTASPRLGMASALLTPLLFQFRAYHDPILSFCFLLPLLWTLLLGSLLLLDRY